MKAKLIKSRILAALKPFYRMGMLVILLALSFSYAMFEGGFVSWFLFFSFLPFALYSFLLLLYPLSDFKVERLIHPEQYNAGEKVHVAITLSRKLPFPLFFLIVEDLVPDSIYQMRGKKILFPWMKRKIELSYEIEKIPRGEYTFEAIRLKTGDLIGLMEKERWFDSQRTILVYPEFEEIIYRRLESRYEQGATTSNLQFQRDTSLVAGVRQYQPGDRFSWIDWKATARTNEMMAKEFEIRQSSDLLIVLDRTASGSFEAMVKFTASAIKAILRNGGETGLFSVGKKRTFIPIKGGEHHQQQLFNHLARVKPDSTLPLVDLLEREVALNQQPAALIIITSALSKDLIESRELFRRGNSAVIIFVIKRRGESFSFEENALKIAAVNRGIVLKILYDADFRTAFTEVKLA